MHVAKSVIENINKKELKEFIKVIYKLCVRHPI